MEHNGNFSIKHTLFSKKPFSRSYLFSLIRHAQVSIEHVKREILLIHLIILLIYYSYSDYNWKKWKACSAGVFLRPGCKALSIRICTGCSAPATECREGVGGETFCSFSLIPTRSVCFQIKDQTTRRKYWALKLTRKNTPALLQTT